MKQRVLEVLVRSGVAIYSPFCWQSPATHNSAPAFKARSKTRPGAVVPNAKVQLKNSETAITG